MASLADTSHRDYPAQDGRDALTGLADLAHARLTMQRWQRWISGKWTVLPLFWALLLT